MPPSANLYERLGLESSATSAEIKAAVRQAAMAEHPDRGGDAERFRHIIEARDTLLDPERRARYDRNLALGLPFGDASPMNGAESFGGASFGGGRVYVYRWGGGTWSARPRPARPAPHTLRGYAAELLAAFGIILGAIYLAAMVAIVIAVLLLVVVPLVLLARPRGNAWRPDRGDVRS